MFDKEDNDEQSDAESCCSDTPSIVSPEWESMEREDDPLMMTTCKL